MKTPFTCPVCRGKGIVPNGFYSSTEAVWSGTSLEPDKCRSCQGIGVVFQSDAREGMVPAAELQAVEKQLPLTIAFLQWMDRKGGLGMDVHNMLRDHIDNLKALQPAQKETK